MLAAKIAQLTTLPKKCERHEHTGNFYFYNDESGESQWDEPSEENTAGFEFYDPWHCWEAPGSPKPLI